MAIDQDITNLPTPPSRSDSPSDFSDKADTFLAALPQLQTELNLYADEANTTQTEINLSETNAATSEQNAQDWASDLSGLVVSTDYSAKAYAISSGLVPEGSAKDWAIKIGSEVDGNDFSAKKYAIDAEAAANTAQVTANAAPWQSGTTYDTGDVVIGTDANTYRSLIDNNVGNNPVTGDGTNWKNLTAAALVTKAELTKTFTSGEEVVLSLEKEITTAPVVSVTKEVPQPNQTNNDWDVASDGSNYTLHDTAYSTTLTPSDAGADGTFTLGTGSFAAEDVGKRIEGNGGVAFLTATDGSYAIDTPFNDTSTIAAGDWSMFALDAESAAAGLTLSLVIKSTYDISNASLTGAELDLSNQATGPESLFINSSGEKLFVIFTSNDTVFEYTMSIPNDLSTASYSGKSFDVSSQSGSPRGLFFKPDGTKMYVCDSNQAFIYQYSLSSSFDLSTATYDSKSFRMDQQDGDTEGISLNSDGTKLFMIGNTTDSVYEYSLLTPWDISTASYSNTSFSVASEDQNPLSVFFAKNKPLMYIVGSDNDKIHEYSLTAPFDISSASYTGNFIDVSALVFTPSSIFFSDNGEKLFFSGSAKHLVFEYSTFSFALPTSANHTAITSTSTNTEFWVDINSMTADDASNDGSVYYAVSTDDRTTWSIVKDAVANETETLAVTVATGTLYQGGGSQGNVFYIEGNENPPLGLTRGNTYVFDQSDASNSNHPLRFQLTDGTSYTDGVTTNGTPGNAGANTTFVVPNDAPDNLEYYCSVHGIGMGGPVDVHDVRNAREIARDDGGQWQVNDASGYLTEIWVPTTENDEFYALEEAVDVSTAQTVKNYDFLNAVFEAELSVSSEDTQLAGVFFKPDGTKMYLSGNSSDSIHQYSLSTPWDLSTASYDSVSLNVSAQNTSPAGIFFKDDGTEMYLCTFGNIYQYTITTPWDLSSASYSNKSLNVFGQDDTLKDIVIRPDGQKMFAVFANTDSIYQYTLGTPWDISTGSYDGVSFSVNSEIPFPTSMFMVDGGETLYVSDFSSFSAKYSLSTSWDLSTISYTGETFDSSSISNQLYGIFFDDSGSKMYLAFNGLDAVQQFNTQSLSSTNRMDAAQLNAVSDGNHYTLGDDLDLAVTLTMPDSGSTSPTSDGVSINYDATAKNSGAILGTDYEWDRPAADTVNFKALSNENFKIRVV